MPGGHPPTGRPPSATGDSIGSAAASASSLLRGEAAHRLRWLGAELWHDRCADMSQNELALQVGG
jgi:hypothetical protein